MYVTFVPSLLTYSLDAKSCTLLPIRVVVSWIYCSFCCTLICRERSWMTCSTRSAIFMDFFCFRFFIILESMRNLRVSINFYWRSSVLDCSIEASPDMLDKFRDSNFLRSSNYNVLMSGSKEICDSLYPSLKFSFNWYLCGELDSHRTPTLTKISIDLIISALDIPVSFYISAMDFLFSLAWKALNKITPSMQLILMTNSFFSGSLSVYVYNSQSPY